MKHLKTLVLAAAMTTLSAPVLAKDTEIACEVSAIMMHDATFTRRK